MGDLQELEREEKKRFSSKTSRKERSLGFSPEKPMLNFSPTELYRKIIDLFSATECVIICYSSNRNKYRFWYLELGCCCNKYQKCGSGFRIGQWAEAENFEEQARKSLDCLEHALSRIIDV